MSYYDLPNGGMSHDEYSDLYAPYGYCECGTPLTEDQAACNNCTEEERP